MIKKRKCPYCNDSGLRDCNNCGGQGYNKTVNPLSFSLYGKAIYERVNCDKCNGTGKVPCKVCKGIGWFAEKVCF